MANVLVKLLSGAQNGAEFVLEPGNYSLGSGDADLVLADALVRPRHARLIIGEDACAVEPLEGAEVWLSGVLVRETTPLPPYAVLTLGGVNLALGPEGLWEKTPVVVARSEALPPVPVANGGAEATPPPAKSEAPLPPPIPETPLLASPRPGRSRLAWSLLLLLLTLVVVVAAGYFYFRYRPAPDEPLHEALALLQASGFVAIPNATTTSVPPGTVALSRNPAGRLEARGILLTAGERQKALAIVAGVEEVVATRLLTLETEVAKLAGPEGLGKFPGVSLATEPGRFSAFLKGLVDRPEDSLNVYRLVRERLHPQISIRRQLESWSETRREAELAAKRVGIPGARFERGQDGVRLDVQPWPEAAQLTDLAEELRDRLGEDMAALFLPALTPLPETQDEVAFFPEADFFPEVEVRAPVVQEAPPPSETNGFTDDSGVLAATAEGATVPETILTVSRITPKGFYDQAQEFHSIGDYLAPDLRLVGTWRHGVVLARGDETILLMAVAGN
ncbi:MAG: FHA domain-containing protein [Planctomycetota bacterium]|nr:FHA domain-containing protein [Planctomycetota bacterium]